MLAMRWCGARALRTVCACLGVLQANPYPVTGCAALALFVSFGERLGAKVKPRPSLEGDLVSSQPHLVFRAGIQQSHVVKANSEADQCRAGGLLFVSLGLSR